MIQLRTPEKIMFQPFFGRPSPLECDCLRFLSGLFLLVPCLPWGDLGELGDRGELGDFGDLGDRGDLRDVDICKVERDKRSTLSEADWCCSRCFFDIFPSLKSIRVSSDCTNNLREPSRLAAYIKLANVQLDFRILKSEVVWVSPEKIGSWVFGMSDFT